MILLKLILNIIGFFTGRNFILYSSQGNKVTSYVYADINKLVNMTSFIIPLVMEYLNSTLKLNWEGRQSLALIMLSYNIDALAKNNNIHIDKDELYNKINSYKDLHYEDLSL